MANASNRITHVLLVLVLFALLAVIGMLATTARGGPLDPPAGAPASTDGVRRPGTPISSLPFVISQPGSYYLTRNLTGAAGTTGIAVNASNVTIDLGGFTLTGGSTNGAGIEATQYQWGIHVTNGNFKDWGTAIALSPVVYSRVDNVTVIDAQNVGINLGPGSLLEDCNVSSGANEGVRINTSIMRGCTVFDHGTSGVTIDSGSVVHDNLVIQNNLSQQTGYADVVVAGNSNFVERNNVGGFRITGDRNLLDGNMTNGLTFGVGSEDNSFVRGRWCQANNLGTDNVLPWDTPSHYEDTGAGHLAIKPERNVC